MDPTPYLSSVQTAVPGPRPADPRALRDMDEAAKGASASVSREFGDDRADDVFGVDSRSVDIHPDVNAALWFHSRIQLCCQSVVRLVFLRWSRTSVALAGAA